MKMLCRERSETPLRRGGPVVDVPSFGLAVDLTSSTSFAGFCFAKLLA